MSKTPPPQPAIPTSPRAGPDRGVATIGQIVRSRAPEVIETIAAHFEALCADFTDRDGALVRPHAA